MIKPLRTPLAWVESPLQLLCAAEYAARIDRPVAVALRLTGEQMPVTAQELLRRGALFSTVTPYFGIPWGLLRSQPDWIIGDGFSGQFRMAAAILQPHTITLVDDGDMSHHLAAALLGRTDFARPGVAERRFKTLLGSAARERMLRLAASERLTMFTAFASDPAVGALASRDVTVETNGFDWLRSHARPIRLPHPRVVLGSAHVTDGRVKESDYLDWVQAIGSVSPVSYLPHRRESRAGLALVSQLPGIEIVDSGMPAELVLAGTTVPLEIVSKRSSAATTLRRVLEGTGSTIRASAVEPRNRERVEG